MGPGWIDVKMAAPMAVNPSWCKLAAEVDNQKMVSRCRTKIPAPPIVVLSLTMQTILNRKKHTNEILAVNGIVHSNVAMDGPTENENDFAHFTAVRKLQDMPFPFDFQMKCQQTRGKGLQICSSERHLLGFVMAKIGSLDPDVIVGHNLLGFDLDVLLHRIKALNVPHWSRIGRLRRSQMPKLQVGEGLGWSCELYLNLTLSLVKYQHGYGGRATYAERTICVGRLLCDIKVSCGRLSHLHPWTSCTCSRLLPHTSSPPPPPQISAREFIKIVNYEMNELVSTQLGVKRTDIDPETIPAIYG